MALLTPTFFVVCFTQLSTDRLTRDSQILRSGSKQLWHQMLPKDIWFLYCEMPGWFWDMWEANSSLENSIVSYCLILNTRSSLLLLLQITGHSRTHLTLPPLSTVFAKYCNKASSIQTIESVCERMETPNSLLGVWIKKLNLIRKKSH